MDTYPEFTRKRGQERLAMLKAALRNVKSEEVADKLGL
jgi:hypothetical protein